MTPLKAVGSPSDPWGREWEITNSCVDGTWLACRRQDLSQTLLDLGHPMILVEFTRPDLVKRVKAVYLAEHSPPVVKLQTV